MKESRRQFLATAGGTAAATTAGCVTIAQGPTPPAPADNDFDVTVNVLNQNGGAAINPSYVHLEPRQSGLDAEDGLGNTPFNVASQGYYDIEVSAPGFYDDALTHKWVTNGTTKTIHLVSTT